MNFREYSIEFGSGGERMIKVFGPEDFSKLLHLPAHVQASIRTMLLLHKVVKTVVLVAEEEEDIQAIRELQLGEHCMAVERALENFDSEETEYMTTRLLLDNVRVIFYIPRAFIPVEHWLGLERD